VNAVPRSVEEELAEYTSGEVRRVAGENRYATAAAISASFFTPRVTVAYVATGGDFPDALA
jgi:putative cell wall-binding protein